jgi:PadR family transcriptional regulator, regulatory protein AphA
MTRLSTTEYAVLGLLVHVGREISGYDLLKFASRSVAYIWAPSRSQLYTVLARLVDAGLATRREVRQPHRPDKQLYRVSPAGRGVLVEWLDRVDDQPDPDRNPFLLKLFFGAQADRVAMLAQLQAYRDSVAERLIAYEGIERHIVEHDSLEEHFPYMTLRFGIARARATLDWADATLAELRR